MPNSKVLDLLEYINLTKDPPTGEDANWWDDITEDMIKPDTPKEIRERIVALIQN